MANNRKLIVEIIGDTSNLERAFKRAGRQSDSFGRRMESSLGRLAKGGVFAAATAGVVGLTVALKVGFDEMMEGQKVTADTNAVLKSTGGIAGVSAKQIEAMATSMSQLTAVDDEAIQGAQNLLLTFTNVRNVVGEGNDIFTQATRTTLDLSRRFGKDLTSSAIVLGKALNDPIKGISALSRMGVQFTAQQKKTIKALVDSGNVLEAQKVILRELEVQVGGAAAAYRNTLPGSIDVLKNSLSELSGELVETLAPAIQDMVDRFNKWIADPENKKAIIDGFTTVTHGLGVAFQFAADRARNLKTAWDALPDFSKEKGFLKFLNRMTPGGLALETWNNLFGGGGGGGGGLVGGVGGGNFPTVNSMRGIFPPSFADREGGLRGAVPPGAGTAAGGTKGPSFAQLESLRDRRNQWFDAMIGRKLDRARDLENAKAQNAVLGRIADEIRGRLAITKDITRRLKLEDELFDIGVAQRGLQQQIKANAIEAKQTQLALAQARFAEKQNRAKRRQFRALGLTATGEQFAPSVGALRTRLSLLTGAIQGTFLDTKKGRSVLAGVRQALKGPINEIGRDVKLAVKAIFDDIDRQMKEHSNKQTFRKANIRGILRAAGLDPQEVKAVSGALTRVGRTGASSNLNRRYTIHTTVNLDGRKVATNTTNHQIRGRNRNPSQKRGPFAGRAI